METWQAFNRYTRAMVEFPQTHPIRLPSPVSGARVVHAPASRKAPAAATAAHLPCSIRWLTTHRRLAAPAAPHAAAHRPHCPQADPLRNYTAVDQDLIGWQTGITQLYGRISRMAVVGVVTDSDAGLEFAFTEAHAGGGWMGGWMGVEEGGGGGAGQGMAGWWGGWRMHRCLSCSRTRQRAWE